MGITKMKTFEELKQELLEAQQNSDPKAFKPEEDSDDEVLDYEPRSKGEKKFKEKNTPKKIAKHPIAHDHQFTGGKDKSSDHKGFDKKHAGEMEPVKQGSSKIKESLDLASVNLPSVQKMKLKKYLGGLNNVTVSGNKVDGDEAAILKALDKFGAK